MILYKIKYLDRLSIFCIFTGKKNQIGRLQEIVEKIVDEILFHFFRNFYSIYQKFSWKKNDADSSLFRETKKNGFLTKVDARLSILLDREIEQEREKAKIIAHVRVGLVFIKQNAGDMIWGEGIAGKGWGAREEKELRGGRGRNALI